MPRRAFTLIEVLLAMALLVALMTAFFMFFRGMETAQSAAREMGNKQRAARTLCDMIERDLMCCIAGDGRLGPGVKGSDTELSLLARNVSVALAVHGYTDRQALNDIESARYAFHESDRSMTISRETPSLLELPKPETETETAPRPPAAQPAAETLGPIERLRFRYFDGSNWHETFDSVQQNRLPVAVEVSIWLRPIPVLDEHGQPISAIDERDDVFGSSRMPDDERPPIEDELNELDVDQEDEENIPPPDVVRIVIIPDAVPVSRSGGAS